MPIIFRTAVHKEVKRVVMRDGDPALVAKAIHDMAVTETTEEEKAVVDM